MLIIFTIKLCKYRVPREACISVNPDVDDSILSRNVDMIMLQVVVLVAYLILSSSYHANIARVEIVKTYYIVWVSAIECC